MELFFLGLLELAAPLATAALYLMIGLLLMLADLVVLLNGRMINKKDGPEKNDSVTGRNLRRQKRMRLAKRVLAAAAALVLVIVSAAVVADRFYHESLTRWMLGRLEGRAGVIVDFARVEGSFFSGEFKFTDLRFRRAEHPLSVFDLKVKLTEVDLSMKSLIRRKIVFDRLNISEVSGFFEQTGRAQKGLRARRPFQLHNFSLTDLKLDYRSRVLSKNIGGTLILDFWRSDILNSDLFIAGLFFSSNLSGSFEGQSFSVSNTYLTVEKKYKSVWSCEDISTEALASVMGWPFTWFESGRVDVAVVNQAANDDSALVEMDWNLVFRDFKAHIPGESIYRIGADFWAWPAVNYMNSKKDRLDLGFKAKIRPDDLKFATTDDLSQIVIELVVENFKVILKLLNKPAGPAEALRFILESQKEKAGQAFEAEEEGDSGRQGKVGRLKSFFKRKDGPAGTADEPSQDRSLSPE